MEALPVILKEKVPVDEPTLNAQPFVSSILFFGFGTMFLFVLLWGLRFSITLVSLKRTSICRPVKIFSYVFCCRGYVAYFRGFTFKYSKCWNQIATAITLNSPSSFSSCLALYACLGFLSIPGFRALLPTGLGAMVAAYKMK